MYVYISGATTNVVGIDLLHELVNKLLVSHIHVFRFYQEN